MMTKRSLLAVGFGALLSGCSTLSLFNRFTPKDSGVTRVAHDVAFGDHERQRYDVYAPKEARNLPVLVFFYGGGWNSGTKDDYVWMGHALAAMGYVVVIPDYRLVPEVHYPVFLDDNAAAIRHVLTHIQSSGGDPKRLGTIGQSAGGYAAVMMALDARYLPENTIKACVGIAGPYDFYPFDVKASIDAFSQAPDPRDSQPVHHARKVATQFLLLHSLADTVVGSHNAVNLERKLREAGTAVTVKAYDSLSHTDTAAVFSRPFRGKAPLYADTAEFLKRAL